MSTFDLKTNATSDYPVIHASPIPIAPPESAIPMEPPIDPAVSLPIQKTKTTIEPETDRWMQDQGYTRGLSESILRNTQIFPSRIWIVDNSGSMNTQDGHRLLETKNKNQLKFVNCTRWVEMQQTVDYHAQMASLLRSPTTFRMLNDPGFIGRQNFSIAERGEEHLSEDLAIAQSTMANTQPGGVTPLSQHIREIRASIVEMQPLLRQNGTKVAVIIATDGMPTDSSGFCSESVKMEFTSALRSLEGLPVWVVVRLCTDEDDIVEYWNDLDNNLELSLEVLDDFVAEAKEVYEYNKWLNYGLPMHRMREMGFYHRLFDLLDERKLSKGELREFFCLLFGRGNMDGVPDPEADWSGFLLRISQLNANEKKQWNPVTKRMESWINMRRLRSEYTVGLFSCFSR